VTAIQLVIAYATGVQHVAPWRIGVWTWPEIATVFVAALALYLLIRTRWLAPLVLAGFVVLTVGTWLFVYLGHTGTKGLVLGATALLGLGAGATVSPALWLAALSTSAKIVGRVFALVELIRAEADYIVAPVLRKVSVTSAGTNTAAHGIRHAISITTLISIVSLAACLVVWFVGRQRLERPDLHRYVDEGEPALES
jgi:hypothetical protein